MKQKRTKKKLTAGIKCGYCPIIIFLDNEAGKVIHYLEDKPACARCRIIRSSKVIKLIKKDKSKFEKEKLKRETIEQEIENARVHKFALQRQIETKTGRLQTN